MMIKINGDMLIISREYREMTQEVLAKRTGVAQSLIAKIEGGMKNNITEEMMKSFSSALNFPPEFFCQNEDLLGFGSSAYFYRKKSTIPAVERKKIHSTVNIIRITIKKILNFVEIDPSIQLPEIEIDEYGGSATQAAKAIRVFWKLPDGPIKNLTALLESAGIIIVSCDFGTRAIDATSLRLAEMPPLIFINNDIPGDRWRFTLAHELCHLVMHRIPHENMEREADEFAAEFLVPEEEIKPQFMMAPSLKLPELIRLKEYWRVSISMLLMRAKALKVINDSQSRYQFMMLSKRGYRLNEPAPLPRESATNLNKMIIAITDQLKFTKDDFSKAVMLYQQEVDKFFLSHEKYRPRMRLVK